MSTLNQALAREPRLPRFLCHLYQRLHQRRLNLVTGAGISIDAGVPDWYNLLDLLAAEQDVLKTDLSEHRKAGLNPEYLGQIIYHRFKHASSATGPAEMQAATVEHGWGEAIHQAIYNRVPQNISEIVKTH